MLMRIRTESGQTLVSTLVSVAITSIVIAVMATMFTNQQKETLALTEKLAALDFTRAMTGALVNPQSCGADVGTVNVMPGSNLTFSASTVTSVDPLNPTVLVNLKNVYNADGSTLMVTPGNPVSPLSTTLIMKLINGAQIAGYKSGTNINYVLMVNFEQSKLVRPLRILEFPVILTTTASGASLKITGCQGSSSAGSGSGGDICGSRTVFCGAGNIGVKYDTLGGAFAPYWIGDNVPCQGTSLTATCGSLDSYGYGNLFVTRVMGCPAGYTGASTMLGCQNGTGFGCGATGNLEIGNLFCRKNPN